MLNADQIAFWNGDMGVNWVEYDALIEAMLSPVGDRVLDTLSLSAGTRALDVGCGCGHSTLSLASLIGPGGDVTGIDVSAPMLALAEQLAAQETGVRASVTFLESDAQTHSFDPESVDVIFSRFGVMFFEDPVAAFRNIGSALTTNGQLAFCCWQPRAVNPFMTLPAIAALELLPAPPETPPRAPGPFAFEEALYIDSILTAADFSYISVTPISHPLIFGSGLSVEEIVERLVNIGPIAQMVREAPEDFQQPVRDKVIEAVSPHYEQSTGMTLDGHFWQVTARR
ncbi:MAG: SAM-dependent methyltransferase [Halieaceae bacterium]|nr:SAM-dependent methyltransferase [Halieaceae bacterium]